MIRIYLKTAWRSILAQKATSTINIMGLAIGMWAAILIFIWVQNEWSFDRHHKDADRIFLVKNYVGIDQAVPSVWDNSPYLLGEKAREKLPEVLKVARLLPVRFQNTYFNYKGNLTKEPGGAYADSTWFDVFPSKVLEGSIQAFNDNPGSIILTQSKARKYFGNDNPVGEIISIDTVQYRVQAVIADPPTNSSFQASFYLPIAARMTSETERKQQLHWGNYNYLTFLKLAPGSPVASVEQKLTDLVLRERQREKKDMKAGLVSLPELHFDKSIDRPGLLRGDKKTMAVFSALGILLLAIACINYINLTTARATLRMKEVSIRKIVGADRKELFAQFITESFLVSFLALVIAMLAVYISLPFYNDLTEKSFTLTAYSYTIWSIALGIFGLSVLLGSVYPALMLSSFKPVEIFNGRTVFSLKSGTLRKVLVTGQFVLSILLIISTIIVYRQMQFIHRESGVAGKEQIFTFSLPFKIYRQYNREQQMALQERVKQELSRHSSIAEVSRMNGNSFINNTSWSTGSADWDGRDKDFEPKITFFETDTSFRSILGLELAEGRWFLPGKADGHNSVVNETALAELGIRRPAVGQRFVARGDTGVIIGVVKDFYYKKMSEKTGPVVIVNSLEYASTYIVKSVPGRTMEARDASEKVWKSILPNDPFDYTFLDDEFEALYRTEAKVLMLVKAFSSLAIFISCLGLFGLAAFTAERRKKEIGVRKVLGASVSDIVTLISKDFVLLVLIALVIASPVAWWAMNSWLQDFAYRVRIESWVFVVSGVLAVLVALVTVGFQAVKAAVANPVKSLRSE